MKKYLLPRVDRYFKTNLHTHSTISDGRLSPQEVKDAYKAAGYQVLALTDHNVIVDHSHMNEEDFLMLTGIEINHNHKNYRPRFDGQVYHLNLIAKRPDNLWTPNKAIHKYPGAVGYEEKMECEYMDMSCTPEAVNAMIAKANEKGFLVMYNHPTWSLENYGDYMGYHGMHAMEMFNGGCNAAGWTDRNDHAYDDMLRGGERIYCIGADDNHNNHDIGWAWTVIKADSLDYRTVTRALEEGNFYASEGPEIHALWYEDGKVHIECSEAERITLNADMRYARAVHNDSGQLISADIPVNQKCKWFRLTVFDKQGRQACTNAYFLDELNT